MIYEVKHKTVYKYHSPVSLCHNIVFQVSANNELQEINSSKCTIDPEPNFIMERKDFFENKYLYFSVQKVHKKLIVESISQIKVNQPSWAIINPTETPAWETVVAGLLSIDTSNDIRQFYLESPHVTFIKGVHAYTLKSFTPNRPIMEAMLDLNTRIYSDFTLHLDSQKLAPL